MNINVQFPELTVQVIAEHTDSVKDLKSKMSYFSESDEILTFNGCLLSNDDDQLSTLGVTDGSVMSVINRNNKAVSFQRPKVAPDVVCTKTSFIGNIGSFFAAIMPNLIMSSGIIIAAGMLSAGMVVAASVVAEKKQELMSKEQMKLMAKEITEGALAGLAEDNYAGIKAMMKECLKNVYVAGHKVMRFISY